jgi:hypothetical protein
MGYFEAAMALIGLIKDFVARGQQQGALTPDQTAQLQTAAAAIFDKHRKPAPPPPGV